MTQPPGLPYRPEEWEALAHRWPRLPEHEQERLRSEMTRAQRKRFDRTLEGMHEDKRHFAGKVTTREDVVQIVGLFLERQVLPVAARLDNVERWIQFQELPWHKRLKVRWLARWAKLVMWLDSKGIRLVTLEEGENDAGENHGDGDAQRGADRRAEGVGAEVRDGPTGDRLPADGGGRVAGDGGEHDEHVGRSGGRISVVSR